MREVLGRLRVQSAPPRRMNRLTGKERARIVGCLVEGNSMRATQRMTGFAKRTVERALAEVGAACQKLCDERMVNPETKEKYENKFEPANCDDS